MSLSPGHLGPEACFGFQIAASSVVRRPNSPIRSWHTESRACHFPNVPDNQYSHQLCCSTPTGSLFRLWQAQSRSPPVNKLMQNGLSSNGATYYKPTENRKKRGRAFRWWADCKVARGRRERQGCPPRAPSYGCCGHSVSVGLRTLKNWRKGERILSSVGQDPEVQRAFHTVSHRVIASELLDGEGPKNRHEQDFFSV